MQPPCQPPLPNQLCLSREKSTDSTTSSPSLCLLCLAHVGSWTTFHPGNHHWEVGTHQCLPSVKFSREGRSITPSHFTERQVEAGCQNPTPSWQRHGWKKSPSLAAVVSSLHRTSNWHLLKEEAPPQKTSVCQTQDPPCSFSCKTHSFPCSFHLNK